MKFYFWTIILLFNRHYQILAQADPCCQPSDGLTLCYLAAENYCFSNSGSCFEYSLDGDNIRPSLGAKLQATENFSPEGIVDCSFKLSKLPKNLTLPKITNSGCNMIFMPAVFVDPATNQVNSEKTYIPDSILNAVYDWSIQCPNNMVIVSQGESERWGYSVANNNQNPNKPENGNPFQVLFDGPFGKVDEFEQGGFFQGVFTKMPSSGFDILARDANHEPTLVFDKQSRDIISGDIGIFCNGPGDLTVGRFTITNNDVLACNIFALACDLAQGAKFTQLEEELCENEPVLLPNGDRAIDPGIYTDTLVAFNGCDSIVQLDLKLCVDVKIPNIFSPNNDGINDFFVPIGNSKIEIETFKVYNRWGQLVYNNETPSTGWDGNFMGIPAPTDVYVYQIIYTANAHQEMMNGDVTLVR